ncbi:ATP-dependent DNA ligase [Mesobacillus foraminis]|uniref:DNA ligase-1 n=1 Tax=Mesobacillus foraminis TaxID=279826 RepID=A0A4R2AXL6_9BACI|nr:RNA ligase family protein [Mesobacillus foraminis]TCN18425.1 DNA ligase-1 [Mesobacillus foraminis]
MLTFVSPMLLHKSEQPFDSEDYITELKLDGIRLIYSVDEKGKVHLYSRHHNDITSKFPELHSLGLPPGTVLDGELIVSGTKGNPDFEAIMSRFMSNKDQTPVCFVAFDVIQHKGQRVTGLPLIERKGILSELIPTDSASLAKVQFIEGHGAAYFKAVKDQNLEGIVLKRKDSRYQTGRRSHDWLKVINYQYIEVSVIGYRKQPKNFGLLLADSDGKYMGVLELGLPPREKAKVYQAPVLKEIGDTSYIAPVGVLVKFRNYTKAGLLRLPSFVEWLT